MKRIMALVLFVSTTLAFTGCSKDDNSPIPVDNKTEYEGTWEADKLSYKAGDRERTHNYIDFPGENAVSQTDQLVLTKDKATLTEYFKRDGGKPTVTNGTIKNNVITFEKANYTPRTINGITNGQLSLTYNYTMMGSELPITVTYNRKK